MNEWVELAKTFGVPTAMIVALGWFMLKRVWPFLTEQIAIQQRHNEAISKEFVQAIGKCNENSASIATDMKRIADKLNHQLE